VRAGPLDKVIVIERATNTVNADGVAVETWTTLATMRAQLIEGSADEFIRTQGAQSEIAVVFRTRFLDGVTLADRVTYSGRPYNLKQIKELGRRRGLELRAVALGA
jgi:SPP1 family predicted phage head-tail adaptor